MSEAEYKYRLSSRLNFYYRLVLIVRFFKYQLILRIKKIIISFVITESNKCLITMALNLQSESIKKDCFSTDYKQDIEDISNLKRLFENDLWC